MCDSAPQEINQMCHNTKRRHKQVRFDRVLTLECMAKTFEPEEILMLGTECIGSESDELWPSDHFGLLARFKGESGDTISDEMPAFVTYAFDMQCDGLMRELPATDEGWPERVGVVQLHGYYLTFDNSLGVQGLGAATASTEPNREGDPPLEVVCL